MPLLFLSLVLAGRSVIRAGTSDRHRGHTSIRTRCAKTGTNAPLSGARVTAIAMDRAHLLGRFRPGHPRKRSQTRTAVSYSTVCHLAGTASTRKRRRLRHRFRQRIRRCSAHFGWRRDRRWTDVNIPLLKGAVIAGQILDPASGEPVVGTMVMAMRRPVSLADLAASSASGTPRLMPAGSEHSDE